MLVATISFTSWPRPKASSRVICAMWRTTAPGSAAAPVRLLQSPQTLVESQVSLARFLHVRDGRTDVRVCLDSCPDIASSAKFVLIVEKDATFQRLLDDDFCEKLSPCIMITVRLPRFFLGGGVHMIRMSSELTNGICFCPVSSRGKVCQMSTAG